MNESLKKIYFWLNNLGQTSISLFAVLISNNFSVARRVRQMKKVKAEKTVTILANGPSVKGIVNDRKDLLDDTDVLVVNYFGNTPDFFNIKPRYYIILDPAFFDSSACVSSEIKSVPVNDNKSELISNLQKVDWYMTFFVPNSKKARKNIGNMINNPCISVVYYHATRITGFKGFQNYMLGRGQGLPTSRNVIIPAIVLMVLLRYKTIYLYGCEFSWTKTMDVDPDNGMMFFNDRHFYSKDEIRYFGKGGYLWWLNSIVEALKGMEQVENFASSRGTKVINRTIGSFIDAFEYQNPNDI